MSLKYEEGRDEMKIWETKKCGCIRANLPRAGRVAIRCERHRDKPTKRRLLAYFDEGIVRRG
jgi:hypothetical protein